MLEKWNKNKSKIYLSIIFVLSTIIVYQSKMFEVSFPERAICIEHQFNLDIKE